jgi:hypothetical protein
VAGEALLRRLDDIGRSVQSTGNALALLAFGSAGTERDRIDEYSDLDIFVIVREGHQQAFRDDLGWLSSVCPIAYSFPNTPHGYKLMFEDGIYAEVDVFTPAELGQYDFPEGRIVWKDEGVDEAIRFPQRPAPQRERLIAAPQQERLTPDWLIGEIVTNLYVGLGRFHRGEKLSALRFVQGYAIDRIVELAHFIETEQPAHRDAFIYERRFEQRFPMLSGELPRFIQGYDRTPESALAILEFLERHFQVHPAIKRAIMKLMPPHLVAPDEE